MKKSVVLILGSLIAVLVFCAFAGGQSSPKRRTPALTNDDLGVAGREVVPAVENESPSANRDETESIRGSMQWQRDLRRAVEVARSESKLIVVDVYTDWCGWCKRMDK